MFSGIVEEVGQTVSWKDPKLTIKAGKVMDDLNVADSISINGTCLTVVERTDDTFTVDLSPETLRRTNLGVLKPGDGVDLERALAVGGRMGGHIVQGHIDGTLNIMKHYGMLEGDPVKPEDQRYLDMDWVRVKAPEAGIFVAIADAEDILEKGQIIGHIRDLDGSIISKIKSPINGVVHTMFPRRIVNVEDPLYTLLEIGDPTGW